MNAPTCAICGHLWRQHDPEDGMCDSHSEERLGVCECGRNLDWMRSKIAALSSSALAAPATRERQTCICTRFSDLAEGTIIADLTCPIHGVNGTDPGDVIPDAREEVT